MSNATDALQNVRAKQGEYQTALSTMKEAATALQGPDLTEARRSELFGQFEKAEKDTEKLEKELRIAIGLVDAERRQAELLIQMQDRDQAGGVTPEKAKDNDQKRGVFLRSLQYGIDSLTPEERTIALGMQVRGTNPQSAGTAGLGGYLVPTELQNMMIDVMKDYSGILQVATIIPTEGGNPIDFPKRDLTARRAVKTAEGVSSTRQDITYSKITMSAYKYTDETAVTIELLQDSNYNLVAEFNSAFGSSFGRSMNETLTLGDGSGDPEGVVVGAGAGITAASATAITLNEIIALEHEIDPAYRRSPKCGYMLHDKILKAIKFLSLAATNEGAGTWQPNFREGTPARINGYPYWLNQDMEAAQGATKKIILFGDFAQYKVRMVRDMTIQRNDYVYMNAGLVMFYAFARWDGKVFDSNAIKYLANAA